MSTYSFLDTSASITGPGGSFTIGGQNTGSAEEGLTIERNADKNTLVVGADGSPMNSLAAREDGKLTVRLNKTSPLNSALSSMYNTQKGSSAAWGQNTISISNTTLGDSWTLTNVAFKKYPKVDYAKEAGIIEWEFDVGYIASTLGGGGTVASAAALVQQSV